MIYTARELGFMHEWIKLHSEHILRIKYEKRMVDNSEGKDIYLSLYWCECLNCNEIKRFTYGGGE